MPFQWDNVRTLGPRGYRCGYCGRDVGPREGFFANYQVWGEQGTAHIYICSYCERPTFFEPTPNEIVQWPGIPFGGPVQALPPETEALYEEARRSASASAYNGAVMLGRKLLMHVAVEKGADENKKFAYYVDWLVERHYVPPGGEGWVDQIRDRANDANHEIVLMSQHDAERILSFLEMLLKFVYELPARAGPPTTAEA